MGVRLCLQRGAWRVAKVLGQDTFGDQSSNLIHIGVAVCSSIPNFPSKSTLDHLQDPIVIPRVLGRHGCGKKKGGAALRYARHAKDSCERARALALGPGPVAASQSNGLMS